MDGEDLRLAVYQMFAETGRAPDTGTLARRLGADRVVVARGLEELAAARHLVLDGEGAIVMAHPFSAVPLGFLSWAPGCCGGAGVRGIRSRCRTCCRARARCW
jgi:hypothetical protein